jgi:hypothetical protein
MTDPRLPLTDYKWSVNVNNESTNEILRDFLNNHIPDGFSLDYYGEHYAVIKNITTSVRIVIGAEVVGFKKNKVTFEQL